MLDRIMEADVQELDEVEGIGEVRAKKKIKKGLKRLQEKNITLTVSFKKRIFFSITVKNG
ncbi:hypothetical protein BsIDN1_01740 [Bacillus safensis]|uniref:Uncharacterized protein n=1 Tax=Bacillus safensis TaxID=561879 RepID=A0A5S9M4X1_BACIA|nr:hypothetical protein BsIDN1_01740 [Bacillus safensis]